nr:RNA-directed DNA polymerase, eukaryota [Tanacetum cinerariifolium]
MDIEESPGSFFARKRLCIMTSMADNILETFKVIFKGKVYSIRAKELFTWTPCFLEFKESDPFGFYKLLKKPINNPVVEDATSLSHPPGFTPPVSQQEARNVDSDHQQEIQAESHIEKGVSPKFLLLLFNSSADFWQSYLYSSDSGIHLQAVGSSFWQ